MNTNNRFSAVAGSARKAHVSTRAQEPTRAVARTVNTHPTRRGRTRADADTRPGLPMRARGGDAVPSGAGADTRARDHAAPAHHPQHPPVRISNNVPARRGPTFRKLRTAPVDPAAPTDDPTWNARWEELKAFDRDLKACNNLFSVGWLCLRVANRAAEALVQAAPRLAQSTPDQLRAAEVVLFNMRQSMSRLRAAAEVQASGSTLVLPVGLAVQEFADATETHLKSILRARRVPSPFTKGGSILAGAGGRAASEAHAKASNRLYSLLCAGAPTATAPAVSALAAPAAHDGAGTRPSLPPLTKRGRAVFSILQALGPDEGMKGSKIIATLSEGKPPDHLDQSTLTKAIIPELKPRGVKNKRGVGYYVERTA